MTKTFDFTISGTMKLCDCRSPIIAVNDNMTPEEKQAAYEEAYTWFYKVCAILENNSNNTVYADVVYLEDYLR